MNSRIGGDERFGHHGAFEPYGMNNMRKKMISGLIGLVVLGALLAGCTQRAPKTGLPQAAVLPGHNPHGLIVEKIEPATALPGQPFPGEIRVTNQNDEPLFDIKVVLLVPTGLEVLEASPKPSEVTAEGFEWRLGSLGPKESFVIQLLLKGEAGELQNKVIVQGSRRVNAEATGLVTLSPISGLTASITDSPGVAKVGEPVVYTVTLAGQGHGPAAEVTVEIQIPVGMRLATELPPQATLDGRVLRFAPFSLDAGEVRELRVQLIPEEAGDWVVRAVVGYQDFQHRIVLEEGTKVYDGF